MATEWRYVPGDWLCICDVCGDKIRASDAKQRWDGLIVCPKDWETRHSLDFIRSRTDKITVPFSRPRPADIFVDDPACSIEGRSAFVGHSVVGCSVVGFRPGF